MPALPPVPNVLRADLQFSIPSAGLIHTRFLFRYSGGPPNSSDATNLAADIYSPASAFHTFYDTETTLQGVEVTDLSSPSGGQGVHAQATVGTEAGGLLTGGTAVLVNYLIARRYRGGKPRSYFPFFTTSDLANRDAWAAGSTSAFDSALATFFGAVIGTVAGTTTITDHVNVSYYDGFTVVTNPVTGRARNVPKVRTTPLVDVISSFAVSPRPASQRRRN